MQSFKQDAPITAKIIQYPCLRIYSDKSFIVLFTAPKVGVCVWIDESLRGEDRGYSRNIGDSERWVEGCWEDYEGTIMLSNLRTI